jgi:predicted nucleic acid-binding protein
LKFLLDTNVISEVRKREANPQVLQWFEATSADDLGISALVVGEIRQGIERLRRRDSSLAQPYETWLDTLEQSYGDRILPVSAAVADAWGRLNVPDPLPVVDGLMAATALVHGLTLVTRNTADVARTGVALLNPFNEAF